MKSSLQEVCSFSFIDTYGCIDPLLDSWRHTYAYMLGSVLDPWYDLIHGTDFAGHFRIRLFECIIPSFNSVPPHILGMGTVPREIFHSEMMKSKCCQ